MSGKYTPPEPNSARWMELSVAYHKMKWMDSSDAVRWLAKFIEKEKNDQLATYEGNQN